MELRRHGDLIIKPVRSFCKNKLKVVDDCGVLARGETTGHKHQLMRYVVVYQDSEEGVEYFELGQKTKLVHEEHATQELEPGLYQVSHKTEYDPITAMRRRSTD